MNLTRSIVSAATAPARVGLAAADASLSIASAAVGVAKRAVGESGAAGTSAMTSMLGIDDAIVRANRLARLLDDDAPLGRAVAPDGPIDRLLRPGGVVDMLTSEGGLLDRLTEVSAFERFLHRAYPGQTRFSVEGVGMMIPMLDELIARAARSGSATFMSIDRNATCFTSTVSRVSGMLPRTSRARAKGAKLRCARS